MWPPKDTRFLRTPPYAFEIGIVVAAGALWQLLTQGARDESEEDQAGSATDPAERAQA
jgi:hypothetical protein